MDTETDIVLLCYRQRSLRHQNVPNLSATSRQDIRLQDCVHVDPASFPAATSRQQTDVFCCKLPCRFLVTCHMHVML